MTGAVSLDGKTAVVTGGGRGVGRAISLALARAGAHVHVVSRTASELDETVRLAQAAGGTATASALDATDPVAVLDRLTARVVAATGAPDILVNAAGVFGPIGPLAVTDPLAWIATVQANTLAPYLTCRAFVGGMIARGWGRVVNVSSAASLARPGPMNSAYATSKAALNHLTRCLAAELAGTGVTANVIHPGEVKTAMWRDIKRQTERLGPEGQGMRAWADWVDENGGDPPEKAATLVLSLMADEAATITGQFLWIRDGLQTPIPTNWESRGEAM